MSEEIWVRKLSLVRGPFRFFYTATYKPGEDGFWKLINFRADGYEAIADYPPIQRIQLIQKYGRRAYRAAAEEAEKRMKFPSKAR